MVNFYYIIFLKKKNKTKTKGEKLFHLKKNDCKISPIYIQAGNIVRFRLVIYITKLVLFE